MSGTDLRGFEYAMEPARQRAHHRVDTSISQLGQCQQALSRARQKEQELRERCGDVARNSTPSHSGVIDPWRAMAASGQWLQLRKAGDLAEEARRKCEAEVADAQRQLNRARIEQETFDTHRRDVLAEHVLTLARRQQTIVDQDWLARQQHVRAEASSASRPGERE
ncbi:MAG TPA: hypothetical protein VFY73_01355 [Ideonella sp.]|uniref:hypothetical protein n=1 Tax=Ideonella sp. TaxID=1929293 RepID=UPI002E33EA86|nr:hypothetical protein [Ideonella sp.]HEX5682654.1 hypothetical protein [Ideonella sp.]